MNILCVTGRKGRIQHNRMVMLKKYMLPWNMDVYSVDEKIPDAKKYDLVYYSFFSMLKKKKCNVKTITSITSHKSLRNIKETKKQLSLFDGFSVNNSILFKKWKKYFPKVYYTPNGVDCNFFFRKEKCMNLPLRFGWVGNKDRITKNYKKILKPLIKTIDDVNFSVVATSKKNTGRDLLTPVQMRAYYQSLDFLLVTSSTEGTPNPALEAMSCGVPVISTHVGNVVDIVQDGYNGYLVKDNVNVFAKKIIWIRDHFTDKDYINMSKKVRLKISEWDWSINAIKWKDFFRDFIYV